MNQSVTAFSDKAESFSLASLSSHAHWLLRIALASVFLFHGVGKLVNVAGFAEMMSLPLAVAWLVTVAELAGGLAIVIGAFGWDWVTRLGGALAIPVLIGAIALVHWGQWSFVASDTHPMGGMEFQTVLTLIAAWFVIRGNEA